MKRTVLTFLAATALLAFSGCEKNEKAAIESFKTETVALKTWVDGQEAATKANPMAGLGLIREMDTKMKAIKTDGLPADLKDAWNGMIGAVDKMNAAIAEFPAKTEDMQAFMVKKVTENPKFGEEFGKKMAETGAAMKPASEKLKEVAKKYGIEGLDKIGPEK